MTDEESKAIEARANAAVTGNASTYTFDGGVDPFKCLQVCREDIPALIAEVRRLKGAIKELAGFDCCVASPQSFGAIGQPLKPDCQCAPCIARRIVAER